MAKNPDPTPAKMREWASDYDKGTFYAEVKGSAFDANACAAQAARLRADAAKGGK